MDNPLICGGPALGKGQAAHGNRPDAPDSHLENRIGNNHSPILCYSRAALQAASRAEFGGSTVSPGESSAGTAGAHPPASRFPPRRPRAPRGLTPHLDRCHCLPVVIAPNFRPLLAVMQPGGQCQL